MLVSILKFSVCKFILLFLACRVDLRPVCNMTQRVLCGGGAVNPACVHRNRLGFHSCVMISYVHALCHIIVKWALSSECVC